MNIQGALNAVGGLVKGVTGLGLTLIPLFLVVDIIDPGRTNIVSNLGQLVESFTSEGLVGLVALILVLAIVD
jgi:hypothetical protein|tara:strand:- start:368 stop:583 length:216 start_codon:yes stop_codon:yes gene_type:complete